jgi:hypothetical protein
MTNKRSTGPRSAAGKARSSMNALKTGIYSKSLIIPSEDPEHLTTLIDEYYECYRPFTPAQRDQVDILVRATWSLRRLAVAESQLWIYNMEGAYSPSENAPLGQTFRKCDGTLTRLSRMVSSTHRSYRDALRELERLQSLHPDVDPQASVSYQPQPRPEPAPEPEKSLQPKETKPVSKPEEKLTERTEETPETRGYHLDPHCHYDPIDPTLYKYCPMCAQAAGQKLR